MRSFRSKPVGWRGESHRHSLAARGYCALKGFTKEQEGRIQKVFDENPRLKFKRDKSVKNILSQELTSGEVKKIIEEENPYGVVDIDPKAKAAPDIILTDTAFEDNERLKSVLAHELTHSSEHAKNPKLFSVGANMADSAREEGLDVTSDWINPTEYHAYTQVRDNPSRLKDYKRINAIAKGKSGEKGRKYTDETIEKAGFFRGVTGKYNEELRKSPNLSELKDVWQE